MKQPPSPTHSIQIYILVSSCVLLHSCTHTSVLFTPRLFFLYSYPPVASKLFEDRAHALLIFIPINLPPFPLPLATSSSTENITISHFVQVLSQELPQLIRDARTG